MPRKSIIPPVASIEQEEAEDLPEDYLDEDGKVPAAITANTQELFDDHIDVFSSLTERQQEIYSMRLQGLSHGKIAKILDIRQNAVYEALKDINKKHEKQGIPLKSEKYTTHLLARYDMIEAQLWRLYHKAGAGENSAVQMQAMQQLLAMQREKTKQLIDLGLIQKPKVQVEHSFKAQGPTLVDEWESTGRAALAETIIQSQLKPLPAPQPPSDDEDGVIDAELDDES